MESFQLVFKNLESQNHSLIPVQALHCPCDGENTGNNSQLGIFRKTNAPSGQAWNVLFLWFTPYSSSPSFLRIFFSIATNIHWIEVCLRELGMWDRSLSHPIPVNILIAFLSLLHLTSCSKFCSSTSGFYMGNMASQCPFFKMPPSVSWL